MASSERVRRSIEFQYGVNAEDLIKGTQVAENSVAGLQAKLEKLKAEFEGTEIGSAEFNRLGNEIQQTSSKLKTLDERFEGLGIEQKNAMIVDSFNVVVGAVGAVTGALVAFGVESKVLEGVEKRLLGIITVVSSLREVSNGLAAFSKTWPLLTANITKATAALRAFALANPFTAIAAGIATVVAATYALIKANEEGKKSVEELAKEFDDYNEINQRRATNREKDLELDIEKARLQQGEIAAAEKALQLAKDKLEQDKIDLLVFQARQEDTDTAGETALVTLNEQIAQQEKLLALSEDERFIYTSVWERREEFRENLKKLYVEREKFLQREVDINQNIKKSQNEVIAAEEALNKAREDARKKREDDARKAKEKADKEAEDLAKRAVKQLEDQRQATDDLINLYTELYPEKVTGGQLEFNTELDKTNFELAQQLEILYLLQSNWGNLTTQLRETQDEYDELLNSGEKFFSQEQLNIIKRLREGEKTVLQTRLEGLEDTYLQELALFADNEEYKTQLTQEYEQNRAKIRAQYAVETAQNLLGITSQFFNTIADINQQSLELQLLQAAGNQAAIDKINQDALEKQKKLRIAQTLITTAESILNGFNATSTLPPPFNFIAGTALAAAYTALGAKTIQTISATTLEGGSSGGGFNNIPSGGSGFSLPGGGGISTAPSLGAILPGVGGGRVATAPTIGTVEQEPIRAYVLAGDVTNGVQANIALNNRRRLAG